MIRHFGRWSSWSSLAFSAVLVTGVMGCHHRQVQPVLLPAQTAVPIETMPGPANASLVEAPKTKLPPVPVVREDLNPKKAKKQKVKNVASGTPAVPAPAAATPAPAAPAAASAAVTPAAKAADAGDEAAIGAPIAGSPLDIGVFTVGGDQSPRNKQDATNLIAANERRLTAVSADRARTEASLLSKVKNFQREAEQALNSGDAEGAKTLATKGKLLLDDMDRGVPSQ